MNETIPPISSNAPTPKTSALAIWSLVLGVLSLVCCSIFAAVPGVICGHKALSRIKNSMGILEGRGLAISGLVTSYLGIALAVFIIPMLLAIAIPNFVKARETAQKNGCINNLRSIDEAKHQWAADKQKQTTDIPAESELTPYLTNRQMPNCPAGGDYTINAEGDSATCSIPKHTLE
ncbi:MAG: DUF4190 domain-containing protein [Akkermansiaceae bacterium]|nr:DUF4190 domain-containing protein [Verrucomicrobiales bacterium]